LKHEFNVVITEKAYFDLSNRICTACIAHLSTKPIANISVTVFRKPLKKYYFVFLDLNVCRIRRTFLTLRVFRCRLICSYNNQKVPGVKIPTSFSFIPAIQFIYFFYFQHTNVSINNGDAESIVVMERHHQQQQQQQQQQPYSTEYHNSMNANGSILAKISQMLDQRSQDPNFRGIFPFYCSTPGLG